MFLDFSPRILILKNLLSDSCITRYMQRCDFMSSTLMYKKKKKKKKKITEKEINDCKPDCQ
jgi:hypothetical protein